MYRIGQEAILNATKYADVDQIEVNLFEENEKLHLIVKDEGTGFDVNAIEVKGTGLGLYGMRERAELVNGNLTVKSEVEKGTAIQLSIPLFLNQTEEEMK